MGKIYGKNDKGFEEVLPGANVFWAGTTIGTSANENGMFQITNPEIIPSKLVISTIGFVIDTILVNAPDQMNLRIVLRNSITLKEIDITAHQNSTSYSTIKPIGTEMIGGKELLKAACCNLSESFSTNASVDVAFTDAVSGAKKIQMLGLDGVYTQVLSENIPMLRGLSAAYGLSYIPGTWIDKILVTKGTGSVVNGYESISGQINLEFLKPQDQKKRFFINVYGNEKGRAEVNIHVKQKLNEDWNTMLFTHASSNTMKQDMNKDGFLDMPLTQQYNVFNRWDYNNKKNFEAQLGIKGLYEDRQGGQTNFDYKRDHETNRYYGIGINTRQAEYFSKTGFMFPSTPYKSIGIQTSGKWQQQQMYFGLRKYNAEQRSFYVNAIYANIIKTTNHKYKAGLSYIMDDYNEKFNDSSFVRTESVPGIFAEYTYSGGEKFSLVAGVREDYHNIAGFQFTPRLHLRYAVFKKTTLRLSGGRGFRTSNIFIENQSVFASSREIVIKEKLLPEIAWNYGLSINQGLKLFNREAYLNVDFFRTDFLNQIVVDLDQSVNKVVFYNLKGTSFSNSLQADFGFTPIESLDVKLAYKWYDVETTYNNKLMNKPFIPSSRIMLNVAYATYREVWKFDVTSNWFASARIPGTLSSPIEYQLPKQSKSYFLLQAQITKKFRKFETYLGCENILNYTQSNPVIAAENPFGPNFDASMIYAPIDGRIIYIGVRMSLK
jgi:outer membrane receptor for ferrienterochelin and colicins